MIIDWCLRVHKDTSETLALQPPPGEIKRAYRPCLEFPGASLCMSMKCVCAQRIVCSKQPEFHAEVPKCRLEKRLMLPRACLVLRNPVHWKPKPTAILSSNAPKPQNQNPSYTKLPTETATPLKDHPNPLPGPSNAVPVWVCHGFWD